MKDVDVGKSNRVSHMTFIYLQVLPLKRNCPNFSYCQTVVDFVKEIKTGIPSSLSIHFVPIFPFISKGLYNALK